MKSRPLRLVLLVLFVSFFIVAFAFLSLLIPSFQPHSPHVALRVATFNLWNVMFQWDVRKHKIAQMVYKQFFFFLDSLFGFNFFPTFQYLDT